MWSSGDDDTLRYPARHLFEFLDHHGLLSIGNSPTWRTVTGGSAQYVQAVAARLARAARDELHSSGAFDRVNLIDGPNILEEAESVTY